MNRLKELRKEKNWTQIQIQHYFNIDQSEYSKMERGLRDPTMAQAIEFADILQFEKNRKKTAGAKANTLLISCRLSVII